MGSTLRQGIFSLAILGTILAGNAYADSALYAASTFNVFIKNNYTLPSGDIEGRVAVGGLFTVGTGGISLASVLPAHDNNYDVVAGGNFIAQGGGSSNGNLYDGTPGGIASNFTVNGTLTNGPGGDPVDFSTAFTQLTNLSSTLASKTTTSGDSCITDGYNNLTCTAGSTPGLHIINVAYGAAATQTVGGAINTYDLAHNTGIIFNIPTGVTLVINVAGSSPQGLSLTGAGWSVNGDASKLLINFSQATTLTLGGAGFRTSLLAPLANVAVGGGNSHVSGQFHGNFIASAVTNGDTEFHNDNLFTGDLSSVETPTAAPEPGTWILMITGCLLAGLSRTVR